MARDPAPSLAQGLSGSSMKKWAAGPTKTDTERQDAANARRARWGSARKSDEPDPERGRAVAKGQALSRGLNPNLKKTEAELQAATKSFPMSVKFEGKTFSKTGKVGTNMKSGEPSAEYRSYGASGHEDDRVWRTASGKIARD